MNLNRSGIRQTDYISENQILFCKEGYIGVGVVVAATAGTEDDETGKKIVKAGTPLTGDLTARTTAFTKASTGASSNVVGVLYRDLDVTDGDANATLMIAGYVNIDRLDSTVQAMITNDVKTALKGNITFLK